MNTYFAVFWHHVSGKNCGIYVSLWFVMLWLITSQLDKVTTIIIQSEMVND